MDLILEVHGYHGTKKECVGSILSGGFRPSRNEYDWLGDGVYFFQDAPTRAWEWATSEFGNEAAVVGSLIRLEGCMDLLDIEWFSALAHAYDRVLDQMRRAGLALPVQTSGAHRLDRAVINYAVGALAESGTIIKTVRAAFDEGAPAFPGSALFDRSHVQVSVRDLMVIQRSWEETKET
jgi:hypothetical protein